MLDDFQRTPDGPDNANENENPYSSNASMFVSSGFQDRSVTNKLIEPKVNQFMRSANSNGGGELEIDDDEVLGATGEVEDDHA